MVNWKVETDLIPYSEAVSFMENRANAIANGDQGELIWLVEHPPLYTAGTSAKQSDLRDPSRFPVHEAKRGGQYTYHGPGQRIAYVMLDVGKRGRDVRQFVNQLEEWVITTLAEFDVKGERRAGRVGVWVTRGDQPTGSILQPPEAKIAAIGIRLRKWVSFHGISINVDPTLEHYDGIVPCGIDDFGVTSLADLGVSTTLQDVDIALRKCFRMVFEN